MREESAQKAAERAAPVPVQANSDHSLRSRRGDRPAIMPRFSRKLAIVSCPRRTIASSVDIEAVADAMLHVSHGISSVSDAPDERIVSMREIFQLTNDARRWHKVAKVPP